MPRRCIFLTGEVTQGQRWTGHLALPPRPGAHISNVGQQVDLFIYFRPPPTVGPALYWLTNQSARTIDFCCVNLTSLLTFTALPDGALGLCGSEASERLLTTAVGLKGPAHSGQLLQCMLHSLKPWAFVFDFIFRLSMPS